MASSDKRFEGKVVLITGSSTGFGAAFAKGFSAEGASVSLTGRNVKGLEEVAAECKALGGKAIYTAGDITSDVLRKKLVQSTLSAFGKIDILVNNAGLALGHNSILEPNYENFDTILNVNLRSVFQLSGLCAPEIVKTKGNIVNISSVAGLKPIGSLPDYCVSKAGLDMLSRCMAAELAPHGVRVNGVNPAAFLTDFGRFMNVDKEKQREAFETFGKNMHALGRGGEIHKLVNFVLFVASDQASFMTGTNVPVDGGRLIK